MGLASNLAKLVSKISSGGLLSLSGLENTGADGQVLTRSGGAWSPQALPAGGVTSLNGQTGAITNTDLYAIGSYVIGRPQNGTNYAVNSTLAGSSLYTIPAGARWNSGTGNWFVIGASNTVAVSLVNTGTWRCVSPANNDGTTANNLPGLWVRIS